MIVNADHNTMVGTFAHPVPQHYLTSFCRLKTVLLLITLPSREKPVVRYSSVSTIALLDICSLTDSSTKPSPMHGLDTKPQGALNAQGPSFAVQPPYTPAPTVYHYTNPMTQEHVASLLPPNHPEMVCLQAGAHVPYTKYGVLGKQLAIVRSQAHLMNDPYSGILAAVFWFPLGIGLCLLDRRVKCGRCGAVIDEGICG